MADTERRFLGYDVFKLIVALGLLLVIFLMLRGPLSAGAPAPGGDLQPPTSTAAPTPTALVIPAVQADMSAGRLELVGTAAPGATVQIQLDGQAAGTVSAGPDGRWRFAAETAPGEHRLEIAVLDAAGQVIAAAAPLTVNVPAPITAAPITAAPAQSPTPAASASATAAAPTPSPSAVATRVSTPSASETRAAAAPTLNDLPANALTAGRVTFTGTGLPGAQVQIVLDGQPAGTVTVGGDNRWTFAADLTAGAHTVQVNALDAAGQVSAAGTPAAFTLAAAQRPTATPAAPAGGLGCLPGNPQIHGIDQGQTWLVDRCDTLAYIARQTGIDFNLLIAANPQLSDPDLIFPGQLITLPGR